MEREARVRAEYQEWFPYSRAGVWYSAAALARSVLEQIRSGECRWTSEERLPSDRHFIFRGGDSPRSDIRGSRRTDPPSSSA